MSTPKPSPLLRHCIRVDVETFDNDLPRLTHQIADAIADSPVVQMATQVFVSCPGKIATGTGSEKVFGPPRPKRKEYVQIIKRMVKVLSLEEEISFESLAELVGEAKNLLAKK